MTVMTRHDCGDYLWKADPPPEYGYAQCSCGKWFRRGHLEFWMFLLPIRKQPHRWGGYWYGASGPGCRP